MANQTVYPYGTGGSLPSSIGIVNDLKTGGADKALSAEQGVVIGDYLFDVWMPQVLPTTLSNFYLGSGSNWGNNGKHIVYPVTPGSKIKLSVTSSTNSAWYGFLDSTYTVPSSVNVAIPYATGQSRRQLTYNTTVELTVPEGAAYLCMCPKDWDGNSYTWALEILNPADIKDDFLPKNSNELKSDVYDFCDITEYETRNCFTGPSNWDYSNKAKQQHKVIPVTGGQKVLLRCMASTAGGNFYAWLTSSYTPPSNGDTIPYANNTTRTWLNDSSGKVELTAPSNAAYLCITMRNGTGTGNTSNWEVYLGRTISLKETVEEYTVKKSEVVNNTSDGGVDVPLSAEQGRLLAQKISDGIPIGMNKYPYDGELIKVNRTHYVSARKVFDTSSAMFQGADCYENLMVALSSQSGHPVWIYNLASGTTVATTSIPDEELGFVSNPHFNTINFGTEKYDENDPFPLIYASTGYNDGTDTGALVYRIVANTENNVTTYSLQLIQTLKMPGTGWTEFIVGDERDCYLFYTSEGKIYRMKMPSISQGDVTFDLSSALDVIKIPNRPSWYNSSSGQGHFYYGGRIYFVAGEPSKSQAIVFVAIDLATRSRVAEIDLGNTFGITEEPEAVFIWSGHFCVAFRVGGVYMLYFD